MTITTLPATALPVPEHAHAGGSAGGPGENSAECVCGVTYAGFDTHREARLMLVEHIKAETKTKPVALLEPGEWIDLGSLKDPDIDGEALVRYVESYHEIGYNEPFTLVVLTGVGDPMPSSYRWPARDRARLLTDAEIEKVKAEERREQLARQFEQLAEMARRTDIPFPDNAVLHLNLDTRAAVEAVSKAVGIPTATRWSDGLQVSWPKGRQSYDDGLYVLWNTSEKAPVEPVVVPETPLVHLGLHGRSRCGMSAEEIAAGHAMGSTTIHPVEVTCQDCRESANLAPVEEIQAAIAASEALDREITDAKPADEAPAEQITVHFSFGADHTDPATGENLWRKYVTIVGPSHAACRAAMFASKYGRAWGTDYIAGTSRADQWISQWTEHERIVLPADYPVPVDHSVECDAQDDDRPCLLTCPARAAAEVRS